MKNRKHKSAQDIQDEIFRKMPADKKLEIASGLWLLGKALESSKIDYGKYRSKASSG